MTVDYDLIDEYLADRLDEERLESFELAMLDSTELQDAVIAQRALKDGLAAQTGEAVKKKAEIFSFPKLFNTRNWAYAATLLLGLSVGYQFVVVDDNTAVQIDNIVYLETVRGSSGPRYSIQANDGNLFVVDINPNSSGPYTVTISNEQGFRDIQTFQRAIDYSLKVFAPPLPVGIYTISISGQEQESAFNFEVLP